MTAENTVVDRYANQIDRLRGTTAAGRIVRPAKGRYNARLTELSIDDDTAFRMKDAPDTVSTTLVAKWEVDGPGENPLAFPGRFWNLPDLSAEQVTALPTNQQTRIRIQDEQFKAWYIGLLGHDPIEDGTDPIDLLKSMAETVAERNNDGNPMTFRIYVAEDRNGAFTREIPEEHLA